MPPPENGQLRAIGMFPPLAMVFIYGWHVMKKQQRIDAAPTGRFGAADSNRWTQAPIQQP